MEYVIIQTYNERDAESTYKSAQINIYNNITFDSEIQWTTRSIFNGKIWLSTCAGIENVVFEFEYIFPNNTRKIDTVIKKHGNWNIENKHASFYSGTNPDPKETFFLDEMMLLRGGDGMIDSLFDKIGTDNITIFGKTYDTVKFQLNASFSIVYLG
jgi:hypothetical protein